MTSINFPSTLEKIWRGAFQLCTRLVTVEVNEGLEEIGDHAFLGCGELRNLFIPSSVTTLGGNIFGPEPPRLLVQQFPNDGNDCTVLINQLKTRFDGLPIHCGEASLSAKEREGYKR